MGTLALVGAGEFLAEMRPVDAALLERAGGDRVVILPTASAPDGGDVPGRWAEMGVAHFRALGAQAAAVMALDRDDCHADPNVESVRRQIDVLLRGKRTTCCKPIWDPCLRRCRRAGEAFLPAAAPGP
jgi:hypothetical protein